MHETFSLYFSFYWDYFRQMHGVRIVPLFSSSFVYFVCFPALIFFFSISAFFYSVVHDIAVGTKVRILFSPSVTTVEGSRDIQLGFNKSRLFYLSSFNCLCATTLCIENSHGLCGFHTLRYESS